VLVLPPPEHNPDTVIQMHTWLQLAEQARGYLTMGDLQAARTSAAAMSTTPDLEGLPTIWNPFISTLLAEADAMASAETLEQAGQHMGRMGLACGTCHTETSKTEVVRSRVLPNHMDDVDARMDNHKWGSDWMWFGLVAADDGAYIAGTTVIASIGLAEPSATLSGRRNEALLSRVSAAAVAAAAAEDDEARAHAYGVLLATCASCHAPQ
jgi:mono/diheme cytochrome c family protein